MNLIIRDIYENIDKLVGEEVVVWGVVIKHIKLNEGGVIELKDGSIFEPLKVVYDRSSDSFDDASKATIKSKVEVRGTIQGPDSLDKNIRLNLKSIDYGFSGPYQYPMSPDSFATLRERIIEILNLQSQESEENFNNEISIIDLESRARSNDENTRFWNLEIQYQSTESEIPRIDSVCGYSVSLYDSVVSFYDTIRNEYLFTAVSLDGEPISFDEITKYPMLKKSDSIKKMIGCSEFGKELECEPKESDGIKKSDK